MLCGNKLKLILITCYFCNGQYSAVFQWKYGMGQFHLDMSISLQSEFFQWKNTN